MSWFYLALLAPLLYAIVNLTDDNLLRFVYRGPYLATTISGLFGMLPLVSLFIVDWSSISHSSAFLMVLTGFLTTLFLFFYFRALEHDHPSVVVALFNLVPATLPFLALVFLDERLTQTQLVGFLIVLLASTGIAAIDVKKFKFSKALVPALIAVGLLDITALLSKYVYNRSAFYPAFMMFSLGLGLGGIYFSFILFFDRGKHDLETFKGKFKKALPLLVLVELIALAGLFVQNLAVSRGPVTLVETILSIQPLYILIISVVLYPFWPQFFREASAGGLTKKFTLMAVIVFGLYLIGTNV